MDRVRRLKLQTNGYGTVTIEGRNIVSKFRDFLRTSKGRMMAKVGIPLAIVTAIVAPTQQAMAEEAPEE